MPAHFFKRSELKQLTPSFWLFDVRFFCYKLASSFASKPISSFIHYSKLVPGQPTYQCSVKMTPAVFVVGATGQQGGAVARHLLALQWKVHAISRNTESPAARAIADAGAVLTKGDWDDEKAIRTSMHGCEKLFFFGISSPADPAVGQKQAERIFNFAKEAGVKQAIMTSSLGVSMHGKDSRLQPGSALYKFFGIKKDVEQALVDAQFQYYTFIRPTFFMTSFLKPAISMNMPEIIKESSWTTVLEPETRLALVDPDDIGKLSAAVFQRSEEFHGRAIGLASELLTAKQVVGALGKAMGRPIEAKFFTDAEADALGPGTIGGNLHKSMRYMEDHLDMEELKRLIDISSFEEFLSREDARVYKYEL